MIDTARADVVHPCLWSPNGTAVGRPSSSRCAIGICPVPSSGSVSLRALATIHQCNQTPRHDRRHGLPQCDFQLCQYEKGDETRKCCCRSYSDPLECLDDRAQTSAPLERAKDITKDGLPLLPIRLDQRHLRTEIPRVL